MSNIISNVKLIMDLHDSAEKQGITDEYIEAFTNALDAFLTEFEVKASGKDKEFVADAQKDKEFVADAQKDKEFVADAQKDKEFVADAQKDIFVNWLETVKGWLEEIISYRKEQLKVLKEKINKNNEIDAVGEEVYHE